MPLRVFISSPGDVESERRRAAIVLERLKRDLARFFELTAVLWEQEPLLASGHFQDCIVAPSATDIVVIILWSRLGTALPERTSKREYRGLDGRAPVTGTEWEFEDALRASREHGIPDLLVYRKDVAGEAKGRSSTEMEVAIGQMRALEAFWERNFQNRQGQFLAAYHRFQSLDQFETMLEAHLRALLTERARRQLGASGASVTWTGCPFRGLQSFEFEHAPVFFGRSRAAREVTEALVRRTATGCAFVLVLGSSGCGKSSLIKAGVVPNLLAPGVVTGIDVWRRAVFRPGESEADGDVFDRFAAALTEDKAGLPELTAGLLADEVAAQFRRGEGAETVKLALHHAAAATPREADAPFPAARLVLVIDQLEELFANAPAAQQDGFAVLLSRLAMSGVVWILASMRSDFFHHLPMVAALHDLAAGEGLYHLSPPRAEEIEQIISRPAQAAGIEFETDDDGVGLDGMLRRAALQSPDALPLLEFALEWLYRLDVETGGGRTLSLATYNTLGAEAGIDGLGGLEGAIAAQAEAAHRLMSDMAKAAMPSVLLALVALNEQGGSATARPARRGAVAIDAAHTEALETLVRARLVVSRGDGDDASIQPAHEALLKHWPRLAAIIRDHRDFLRSRDRIEAQSRLWRDDREDPSRLLIEGNALAEGERLLRRRSDIQPEAVRFIEVSIAAARRRHTRRLRFAWVVATGSLTAAGIAAAGAYFGYQGQGQAERSFDVAISAADALVTKVAKGLRDVEGVPTEKLVAVLRDAQSAFDQLAQTAETDRLRQRRAVLEGAFGQAFLALGHPDEAASLLAKARRELHSGGDLIRILEFAGDAALAEGDLDAAFAAYQQRRDLADQLSPVGREWRLEASRSRIFMGDVLDRKGQIADALSLYQTAADELARLGKEVPDDGDVLAGRAAAVQKAGYAHHRLGAMAEAVMVLQEATRLAGAAVQIDPANSSWRLELSECQEALGDVLRDNGQVEAARIAYQDMMDNLQRLVMADPGNARWQRQISSAYVALANVDRTIGRFADAGAEYRQGQAIIDELLRRDATNTDSLQLAALSHERMGSLYAQQGDHDRAVAEYQQMLAVLTRLAAAAPDNLDLQRDLAVAHGKIGDAFSDGLEREDAVKAYQTSLEQLTEIVRRVPDNLTYERDLALAHYRLSRVLPQPEAGQQLEAAIALQQHLVNLAPTMKSWADELAEFQHAVAGGAR
jgi:eukaryotic-like serine/threonine-protein kinase